MSTTGRLAQWTGARLSRRLSRSVPWIGALVALATIGVAIRRKGWLGGTIDTALNATPYVGAAKNAVEWARGRDLIRDRVPVGSAPL